MDSTTYNFKLLSYEVPAGFCLEYFLLPAKFRLLVIQWNISLSRRVQPVIVCCPWRHSMRENVFSSHGQAKIECGSNFETL